MTTSSTVVLIHGLARTGRSMRAVGRALRAAGYEHQVTVTYPSRQASIADLAAEYVCPVLRSLAGDIVAVVTHSMGGILLRSALQQMDAAPHVQQAVMLGPPNAGSEIVDRLGHWWLYGALLGRHAGRELGTAKTDGAPSRLPALPEHVATGIIAGNRPRQFPVAWLMPGPLNSHDSKVSVASTHLANERAHLVLPVDHDAMLRNTTVHQQILHFLQHDTFASELSAP
jgi:pimeloyl-ACP methyl ester carboxylesterase